MDLPPLAFVDVETTGLDPREDRITEIGVITVDGNAMREWTSVINPLIRRQERALTADEITDEMRTAAPRFKDIATDLAQRLSGRLLIAHNARFDYGFLKAEFARNSIDYEPDVLCSLMLSRRLYSELAHHDLDSLIERHALEAEVRHRALHDARLLWQFWQLIHRELPPVSVANAIDALRAGPLLPAHLDPSLVDRLPEAPGVYVFHDEDDEVLLAASASNLKSRVLNYFRLDRLSGNALAISHRIRNITWRVTQGALGARLQLALLPERSAPAKNTRRPGSLHSWRFAPDASPCLTLVSLSDRTISPTDELFGMFESPRKARNALHRMAATHRLCHSLLGIGVGCGATCPGCTVDTGTRACDGGAGRLVHLTQAFAALRALRVPVWPYAGPIGIREHRDVYIVDRWRYLGTARNNAEIHAALETRAPEFDVKMFRLLAKALRKIPKHRIVTLDTGARPERTRPYDAIEIEQPQSPMSISAALASGCKGCSPPVPCCPHPEPEFKRVACRGLQALPLGSAHQPANGAATALGSIGSKSIRTTRTPQGTW